MSFADSNAVTVATDSTTGFALPWWYPLSTQQWIRLLSSSLQSMDYSAQVTAGLSADAAGNLHIPSYGDPKAGILAYSGGTLRTTGSELLLFGGGGAGGWGGNEIRGLMLESGNGNPQWRTRKNPANATNLWPIPATGPHPYMQDGVTPNARHSYWSPIFHNGQDRFFSFGVLNVWEWDGWPAYPQNLFCDSWTWSADPTSAWDSPSTVAPIPNARNWDGPWTCKHATTEKVYLGGQTKLQEYDPATNTWATKYTNAIADLERRMAAIDHNNNILLTIGQDNGVQHVGNAFDMTTDPFTKHTITWSGTFASIAKTGAVASGWNWAAGFVYCPDLSCWLLYNDDGFVYTITRVTDTNYAVEQLPMSGFAPLAGACYGSAGANSILWGRMQYVPNLHGVVMLLNAANDVWFFRTG